ncbi:hypothetical protein CAP35_13895 [Chitinophagaceae bacterium IBVUCB1]|nr:hypothetical protein CAP35_13895 [Chitinophagaceae bacterium IBVUCB1]
MSEVKLNEIKEESFYAFVAPDGSWQAATTAPDFQTCIAITEVLSRSGICKNPAEMFSDGFAILPVKITVVQDGTEEEGFQRFKKKYNK